MMRHLPLVALSLFVLFVITGDAASAENDERFGAWTVAARLDTTGAETDLPSGQKLIVGCSGEHCVWAVELRLNCRVGQEYPIQIITQGGTLQPMTLNCAQQGTGGNTDLLTFANFDMFNSLMITEAVDAKMTAGRRSIGIRIDTPTFGPQTTWFDLTGAADALQRVIERHKHTPSTVPESQVRKAGPEEPTEAEIEKFEPVLQFAALARNLILDYPKYPWDEYLGPAELDFLQWARPHTWYEAPLHVIECKLRAYQGLLQIMQSRMLRAPEPVSLADLTRYRTRYVLYADRPQFGRQCDR